MLGKAKVNGVATGAVDEEAIEVEAEVGKSKVKGLEAREVEVEGEEEVDVEGLGVGGKVNENGVPELLVEVELPDVDGGEAGGEGASAAATVSIELLPLVLTSSWKGLTRLTGELISRKRIRWGVHGGGASIRLCVRFVLSLSIVRREGEANSSWGC